MNDPKDGRFRGPSGSRRLVGWLAVVVTAVTAAVVGFLLLDGRQGPDLRAPVPTSSGSPVPPSELVGEWAGEGELTRCVGLDDTGCSGSRAITLTIDCSGRLCVVTPFARGYGSPPLRYADGVYRASGPVPPGIAPTCGGAPTASALWRLELIAGEGRLGGRYQESTIQGFDCGATGATWDVLLERG